MSESDKSVYANQTERSIAVVDAASQSVMRVAGLGTGTSRLRLTGVMEAARRAGALGVTDRREHVVIRMAGASPGRPAPPRKR